MSYTFLHGSFLIVLVAALWVMDSMLTQGILVNMNYSHPIFLTYMNVCGFSLWTVIWYFFQRRPQPEGCPSEERFCMSVWSAATKIILPWFFANVAYNVSLSTTSVASNTVLCNTSSLWTLLLSRVVLKTPITSQNALSVALSMAGATFVVYGDTADPGNWKNHSVIGDLLAVSSAMLYALYTILIQTLIVSCKSSDDSDDGTTLLFGLMGITGTLTLWPLLVFVAQTGYEPFALPPRDVLGMFALTSLVGTGLPQLLWAKGVLMTSPLVATLGLSLTIPLSMVADAVWYHQHFSVQYIFGCLLVAIGFIVSNMKKEAECAEDKQQSQPLKGNTTELRDLNECCGVQATDSTVPTSNTKRNTPTLRYGSFMKLPEDTLSLRI